ncbi:aminotransferase class III-fold pyridoxal phosphate-dependent enzyme [Lentibacillus cibarius]|uniref:Aminotransferase class III-fold pyridoxal phosphate-dependent enzyme n=1 Tax=Lentibacillus cibarius TaxID=2583219 RepID=A0A549YEZ4_9BACI|nr:aminotransferase [Lentibacillus cibarius]TMN21545.1 aminotransferase class III-fold pyridoxal phosphate-dependent enzyme [Lentibacillus cibarius]TRM10445.1 aminotransferase class III-fold pyridoxal phosphate-dependent enzyme [Lentibacillus cibarius]
MKAQTEMNQTSAANESHLWNAMHKYDPEAKAMVADSGKGSWFVDEEGNKYMDGVSGLWCLNVGYGREEIANAAAEQLKKLAYFPLTMNHKPAIQLANKLSELLGGDYQTFFSNSGSEANETAFKIARQYHIQTGNPTKYKFISRYRAYHGSTMGAMGATAQANRRVKYDPGAPGFLHVAPPYSYRSLYAGTPEEKDLAAADELEEKIIWEGEETVAAVIMEPFISGGGVIIPSLKYIERVAEICKKHQVLLIMDEVVAGFGRTGEMFGFKHANGVEPDMVTMAKGLTSGYLPLAATSVRNDIYEAFKQDGKDSHFRHVSTYGGHPAACAVALENIRIIEEEDIVGRVKQLGQTKLSELHDLTDHKNVGEVRQKGFLVGLEMVEDKDTKEPLSEAKVGQIVSQCKQKGLIIGKNGDTVPGGNNIIIIAPPLTSSEEDLDFVIDTVKSVIHSM